MKPLTAIYFIVCLLLMTAEYTGESVSTMIAYYGFIGANLYNSTRLINKHFKTNNSMRDNTFDLLTNEAKLKAVNNLSAIEATLAISQINYLLDLVANNADTEIKDIVYMLSCLSEMFLSVITSEDRKKPDYLMRLDGNK